MDLLYEPVNHHSRHFLGAQIDRQRNFLPSGCKCNGEGLFRLLLGLIT